jgi:hypothetical protein
VYELNLKDFSDLDKENVQEEERRLNMIRPNESEMKVNKEHDESALVVEEILGDFLVKPLKEVSVMLEDFLDICPPELPNTYVLYLRIRM